MQGMNLIHLRQAMFRYSIRGDSVIFPINEHPLLIDLFSVSDQDSFIPDQDLAF